MPAASREERKLYRTITALEKAIELCNELSFNATGPNNIGEANAAAVNVLNQLGVIELNGPMAIVKG